MKLTLEATVQGIKPIKEEWRKRARERLDNLIIPPGSLGELLNIAERLAAIQETLKPSVRYKAIVTMAGDHGVVEEGVSNFPQEVTPQMVANFVSGGAGINVLAEVAGAQVIVVDMGVAADLSDLAKTGKILSYKIGYGTRNMVKEPAMTRKQAISSIEAGINIASTLIEKGVELLGTGDMGIGNTTPSSAILAALSGLPVAEVTGRGTGISEEAWRNKYNGPRNLDTKNGGPKRQN
ncbi:MAG: nicotinate-nucleotide--dimethylbenzimidazole phosphoribosyltransferase, partial [Thermanaeromonas sp.]|uniref:nicotinate-nucleotide--dimethylbenzimidazole phosphoribosyltransferase n=1 Tax=Thermanaeromonas sp. TaxID=2003697 RepID=UPI00243D7E73